jgi:signal transduction histidine kinase
MAGSFVRRDKTSQDVPQWVRVDQTLFTTAILNLAINARDAMPNGNVTIKNPAAALAEPQPDFL